MRYKALVLASILWATAAYGEEPKAYQSGKLVQMDAVSCGAHKALEPLCQEYLLQTDKVDYRIRARNTKHPVLLPVGEQAQFRLEKSKMLVRVEYLDNKEREYNIVSVAPRSAKSWAAVPTSRMCAANRQNPTSARTTTVGAAPRPTTARYASVSTPTVATSMAHTGARRDWKKRSVIRPEKSAPAPPARGRTAVLSAAERGPV